MHTEKQIENYLCKRMEGIDALGFKFTSPGRSGVPDRLFILDNGETIYVEVKCKTGRLAPLQEHWLNKIKEQGARSFVVWSYEEVDKLVSKISRELIDKGESL